MGTHPTREARRCYHKEITTYGARDANRAGQNIAKAAVNWTPPHGKKNTQGRSRTDWLQTVKQNIKRG